MIQKIGIIMNGVTGRMGTNQHLLRSIKAIIDQGGIKLAHSAMVDWNAKKGNVDDSGRYSQSQQFFLGFAQSWCTKVRPEPARLRAQTDPHSPPYWRVNGPLGNNDAFKAAFQCTDSDKMIRTGADRCSVW